MNPVGNQVVIYWDASAILSALIKDAHSKKAHEWANKEGAQLLSHWPLQRHLQYFQECGGKG